MAASPWSTAACIVSGPSWYSAKRSSNDIIGLECTSAMAPFAVAPSRSKSARRPSPTSTMAAVTGPVVEGARPRETTRSGNSPGETTEAVAEIPSQLAGIG